MAKKQWISTRERREHPLDLHKGFNHTTVGMTAEAAVLWPYQQAEIVTFRVDNDCYIEFDGPATVNSMELLAGETYYQDEIIILERISILNKNIGQFTTIRGTLWGI